MTNNKICYTKPSITDLEKQYAYDAIDHGWGERCYEYINKFEALFKKQTGCQYAIATSSCTGALHIGLAALGVKAGDEVILADINWVATVSPIIHLGANPVFVDIEPSSWCIDPEKIEQAITPKTKAVIATHLYGNLCDLSAIKALCQQHDIALIEDAAEAIGSTYHGQHAGTYGDFGVYSFHGTKTITTGEGGIFVTNNEELYQTALTLSNHGRSQTQTKQFWPDMLGFKYKMSNVQAAIGCAQLERFDELVLRKKEIFKQYKQSLCDLPVTMNEERVGCENSYWMPTLILKQGNRDVLINALNQQGIDARVFFWPLSMTPPFQQQHQVHCELANPISYSLSRNGLNLPSYYDMNREEIDYITGVVSSFFKSSETVLI